MSAARPLALADIEAAAVGLEGEILRTPTLYSPQLSALTGANVWVKYENMQATGSFKERGAFTRMAALTPKERAGGVVAMSAGNHAQAVAYHARKLGVAATIVMPERTPFVKVAATEAYGASVVLSGATLAEAAEACAVLAGEGRTLIHPYDDPLVMAGQGTVALEMLDDAPDLEVLVVPIGGGGLISGMATVAASRGVRVNGVEAALYPSAHAALMGKDAVCGGTTLAEGIAVKHVGIRPLAVIRALVERVIVVDETLLERAVNAYLTQQKTMAEGAGAAPLAAVLAEPHAFAGQNVGLVLCGGNIDPRLAASIMVRELARAGRIVSLDAHFPDGPGRLAALASAIGAAGGNILEVAHDRLSPNKPAREASVRLTIETKDDAHTAAVLAKLQETGATCRLADNVDARF